jgi:hypothetical protein
MDWISWVSVIGSVGTIGFGVLSLYQQTALTALRRAIKAHTQTAYNNFWNIGNEMDQLLKAPPDPDGKYNHAMTVGRASAANTASIVSRNEVINFGRQCAAFTPKYEPAWDPVPILEKPSFWRRPFVRAKGA